MIFLFKQVIFQGPGSNFPGCIFKTLFKHEKVYYFVEESKSKVLLMVANLPVTWMVKRMQNEL